ncbi:MAG: bifunctional diguanylate cyclase/phosphodiesterase [Phormidesmis sp.]
MEGLLLSKILSTLEVLPLEWHGNRQLSVLGELPSWAKQEFDCFEQPDAALVSINQFSLFLENFMVDAQEFWQAQSVSALKSGAWTEIGRSGKEIHLEAIALYIKSKQRNRHILLIESVARSDEKFQWLQTAREEKLNFISERKIAATKTLSATFYDSLTGLPNRKLFLSQLSSFFEASQVGDRTPFTLVIVNIDRFQNLNSSLGTVSGDRVIQTLADRIRGCLRSFDVPGRFGGDEFGVLIGETEQMQDAVAVVRRLLQAISEPIVIEGRPIALTASAGVAICSAHYEHSRDLLRDAGLAMHRAKALGKGRYALFNHQMRSHALELWNLETALRLAISNNELQLWYQPIVDINTRQVESFESLIRWQHLEYGWVSPDKFIPLAEESGLITAIDKWVLQTACNTIAQWQREIGKTVKLNVNISSRHFSENDLFESVRDAIATTGISPSALCLEITESSLLTDTKAAIRTLNRLKGLGVEIAIDDFGTGYASLSYLQDLPLNKLKIDGYFIEMMSINGSSIVETIITLSHQLGFGVTAERVETIEQYETLQQLGCDTVQGYLFSQPVPKAAARSLINVELGNANRR